jgi:CubicO group peptidase (beta-lactamase class C family)
MRTFSLAPLLLVATATSVGSAQAPWPTKGWQTTTLQEVGLSAAVLDSIDAEIKAGRYGYVDRVLVIRGGRIAYDRSYRHDYDRIYGDSARKPGPLNPHDATGPYNYFSAWWHPYYRRGDLHTLQSVTKTITSVIIGAATARGEFPSLDTPVLSFFDTSEVKNIDDRKRRMTIRHLLTMTAGLDWNEGLPITIRTTPSGRWKRATTGSSSRSTGRWRRSPVRASTTTAERHSSLPTSSVARRAPTSKNTRHATSSRRSVSSGGSGSGPRQGS